MPTSLASQTQRIVTATSNARRLKRIQGRDGLEVMDYLYQSWNVASGNACFNSLSRWSENLGSDSEYSIKSTAWSPSKLRTSGKGVPGHAMSLEGIFFRSNLGW